MASYRTFVIDEIMSLVHPLLDQLILSLPMLSHNMPPVIWQAKVMSVLQGGHIKLSNPSLRPRLYLDAGARAYSGAGDTKEETSAGNEIAMGDRQV